MGKSKDIVRTKPDAVAIDPAQPLKNARQEAFSILVSVGKDGGPPLSQAEAYRTCYPASRKWKDTAIWPCASELAKRPHVSVRIQWLKARAVEKTFLTIDRRKRILSRVASEVGEVDPADHLEAGGDGVYINFGKESKNRGAVAGLKSRTDMSGEGGQPGAVITEIRYRPFSDAVAAIAELNKMDGAYPDDKAKKDAPLPVVFNIVFPSGPRVPPPRIKTITMDEARRVNEGRG